MPTKKKTAKKAKKPSNVAIAANIAAAFSILLPQFAQIFRRDSPFLQVDEDEVKELVSEGKWSSLKT